MTYKEQIAHPKWQKKRLEIFERDKYICQLCLDTETQLHVHHRFYDKTYKTLVWEYPDHVYQTLCNDCHEAITKHIEEYGNDEEFSTLKIRNCKNVTLFVYTKGMLRFNVPDTDNLTLTEDTTHKIVQFLINNWMKNG